MRTTPVPNVLFDGHLKDLKIAELKILLVIIRQTLGWRKERDWIAGSQFREKTGLSARAVVSAIRGLLEKNLVSVRDGNDQKLDTGEKRKGKKQLVYCLAGPMLRDGDKEWIPGGDLSDKEKTCAKNYIDLRKRSQEIAQKFAYNK